MKSRLFKNQNIGVVIGFATWLSLSGDTRGQTTCFGIEDTDPAVCSGHGTCTAPDTCICDSGYTGLQCESVVCFGLPETDPDVCSGYGTCVGPDTCDCYVGFVGNECESLVIPTVPVGNPGNPGELSGTGAGGLGPDRICGGVEYVYSIAEFEVTAGQYTKFLNAVAKEDSHGLWSSDMVNLSDDWLRGCQIQQDCSAGPCTYTVAADWANRPVNYVNWGDAARFANWLHNGQPTGAQDASTTEDGSYYLNGGTVAPRKPDATWVIPSEDEWYKAAYHRNDGVTGNYYDYGTSNDTAPGYVDDSGNLSGTSDPFTKGGPDPGNYATYDGDGGTDGIGSPYYRTQVGEWENSDSPYATSDQGGNVWEWYGALNGSEYGLRGGSYYDYETDLHAARRYPVSNPGDDDPDVGFRVAVVPLGACCTTEGCDYKNATGCNELDYAKYNGDGSTCEEACPAGIPAVSEWGLLVMMVLVLSAGTVVLRRRRTVLT